MRKWVAWLLAVCLLITGQGLTVCAAADKLAGKVESSEQLHTGVGSLYDRENAPGLVAFGMAGGSGYTGSYYDQLDGYSKAI